MIKAASAGTPPVPMHLRPGSASGAGPAKKGAPAASPIKMTNLSEEDADDIESDAEDYDADALWDECDDIDDGAVWQVQDSTDFARAAGCAAAQGRRDALVAQGPF